MAIDVHLQVGAIEGGCHMHPGSPVNRVERGGVDAVGIAARGLVDAEEHFLGPSGCGGGEAQFITIGAAIDGLLHEVLGGSPFRFDPARDSDLIREIEAGTVRRTRVLG